jgi:hypothetical protein
MTTQHGDAGAGLDPPMTLFECHQCAFREWRPADQDTWLCVVCGYFHWHVIEASDEATAMSEDSASDAPELSGGNGRSSSGTGCLVLLTAAALGVLASVFA